MPVLCSNYIQCTDADVLLRFIGTRILSNAALDKLAAHKIPLADVEDAALAVTHLASDPRINGMPLTTPKSQ